MAIFTLCSVANVLHYLRDTFYHSVVEIYIDYRYWYRYIFSYSPVHFLSDRYMPETPIAMILFWVILHFKVSKLLKI